MSLSHDELIRICNLLNVRENQIGSTLKATLLNEKHSRYFSERLKVLAEDEKPITKEEVVKNMSLEQLAKELGFSNNNKNRKLTSKGLYFQKNFEDYCMKFISEWRSDIRKINEFIVVVNNMYLQELMTLEYTNRISAL